MKLSVEGEAQFHSDPNSHHSWDSDDLIALDLTESDPIDFDPIAFPSDESGVSPRQI